MAPLMVEEMVTSWAVRLEDHSEDHQDSLTGLRLVIPKGATKDQKTKTSLPKVLWTTKEELMATSLAVHSDDHSDSLTELRLVTPKAAKIARGTPLPKVLSTATAPTKEEMIVIGWAGRSEDHSENH
jgi:hypothetical protein